MLTEVAVLVQRHDPERFVTAAYAPRANRETLLALYSFNHELARAREAASQPTLALIRLQWWREVIEGAPRRHPVAEALARGGLDRAALATMIDGRMAEAEPEIDEPAWHAYLRDTGGMLMREAGRVLGADGETLAALSRLGAGCAAAGLLRNRAAHKAIGRWSFPPGRDAAWCRDQADTLLGPRRPWPRQVLAAALPAVFARAGGGGGLVWAGLSKRV